MKFSGKMLLMIKSHKKAEFLPLENIFLEKPQGGVKLNPPAFLELKPLNLQKV